MIWFWNNFFFNSWKWEILHQSGKFKLSSSGTNLGTLGGPDDGNNFPPKYFCSSPALVLHVLCFSLIFLLERMLFILDHILIEKIGEGGTLDPQTTGPFYFHSIRYGDRSNHRKFQGFSNSNKFHWNLSLKFHKVSIWEVLFSRALFIFTGKKIHTRNFKIANNFRNFKWNFGKFQLRFLWNLYKLFRFFLGDLRPDPPKPRGDLKIPEGMAGPRGVFQIPDRVEGDLAKIPEEENPNNMHIFS